MGLDWVYLMGDGEIVSDMILFKRVNGTGV